MEVTTRLDLIASSRTETIFALLGLSSSIVEKESDNWMIALKEGKDQQMSFANRARLKLTPSETDW